VPRLKGVRFDGGGVFLPFVRNVQVRSPSKEDEGPSVGWRDRGCCDIRIGFELSYWVCVEARLVRSWAGDQFNHSQCEDLAIFRGLPSSLDEQGITLVREEGPTKLFAESRSTQVHCFEDVALYRMSEPVALYFVAI
jgi:hypothetical protein